MSFWNGWIWLQYVNISYAVYGFKPCLCQWAGLLCSWLSLRLSGCDNLCQAWERKQCNSLAFVIWTWSTYILYTVSTPDYFQDMYLIHFVLSIGCVCLSAQHSPSTVLSMPWTFPLLCSFSSLFALIAVVTPHCTSCLLAIQSCSVSVFTVNNTLCLSKALEPGVCAFRLWGLQLMW